MAYGAENRSDLLRAINEFLDDSIVLPPGQLENPDLLKNISLYQKSLASRREKKMLQEKKEKGLWQPGRSLRYVIFTPLPGVASVKFSQQDQLLSVCEPEHTGVKRNF